MEQTYLSSNSYLSRQAWSLAVEDVLASPSNNAVGQTELISFR